jgi:hypothetical protein
VYLDLDGSSHFLTLDWPKLEVVGREATGVTVFAPSVAAVGENFDITIRTEDRYFNRATGELPDWQVSLNGEPYGSLPAGETAVAVLEGVSLSEPGTYRFSFSSADGVISGTSNPIWVEERPELRVLWGETHVHTGFAEGQGSAEGVYRYAREDARLDFLGFSEHDIFMDAREWQTLQGLARRFSGENSDGRLVPFLAYEWTVSRDLGGHHNVLFRSPDAQLVPLQDAPTLPDLYRGLRAKSRPEDLLVIPHAHQAGDWNNSDPAVERLVEMYSMHGSFEWFANRYLENGFRVGLIAASDDHRARPGHSNGSLDTLMQTAGLAAVLAPAKSRDAIFDALRDRATYATSGQRILVDGRLGGHRIGSIVPPEELADGARISCRVSGTAPIDRIDVIRNGEVILSRDVLTGSFAERSWLQIGFESSSEVYPPAWDNPRPYRVWRGSLRVEGARVLRVDSSGLDNGYLESAELDPTSQGTTVRFHVETRGRRDPILLELAGASPSTVLHFELEPTTEYGSQPVLVRQPAELPGERFSMTLGRAVNGRLEQSFQVDRHTDRIALQLVNPNAPLDRDFEFTDLEPPVDGDYYYLRVSQLDGGRAWSTPWWIGVEQHEQ